MPFFLRRQEMDQPAMDAPCTSLDRMAGDKLAGRGGRARAFALTGALMASMLFVCHGCAHSGTVHTYSGQGRVVSLAEDRQGVTIQHEDITGFMPAMTMLFAVKDPSLLDGLTANDLIRFELTVSPQRAWLSRIEKTGHVDPPETPASTASMTPAESALKPGQPVPPFSLIDQNGDPLELARLRGRAVAITFIFTRCPLPDYCPRFTGHFANVQDQLEPQFGDQFHLLSISLDPDYDTPEILNDYSRQHGAHARTWTFLTGPHDEIKRVAHTFGVSFWNQGGTISHTSACAIVSPGGTLYKLYRGNGWSAEQVVSDLTTLLTHPAGGGDRDERSPVPEQGQPGAGKGESTSLLNRGWRRIKPAALVAPPPAGSVIGLGRPGASRATTVNVRETATLPACIPGLGVSFTNSWVAAGTAGRARFGGIVYAGRNYY